ncbi:hypothetical protein Tco_0205337 [Tanacetum coccineum]
MRQTADSLLFKTINELTNQSFNSETFYPEERIKELELRTQRRNNFEEELFKDRFPTEEELAYHKELLGEPQPPFSILEPKIRRGDPWSLKIPCIIGTVYTGHAYIDLQSPINIMSRLIRFSQRDNEVVFRMPQSTKELDLVSSLEKDKFEAFFVENLKVFSVWKAFGGNTRDLGSFGEETDKITNQHQDSSRFKVSKPGDGVTIYTRRRHTSSSDGVTTSLDGVSPHRLNSDLKDSTL